ncbi:uncharacterized protein [Fopius arisanus]|uniref:Uncharacterized protein n=1 Tax=Fopius arisanus TaxID=64838 RepID=A0A9R1TT11_9HYME|nr:PREDICTED: uncharacterized protein LOC105273800 [Fopius arisanus]
MPFYQFNQFTGRLKNSTNLQPLYPISPNPLQTADQPTMIWDSVKTQAAKVNSPAAGSGGNVSSLPPQVVAKMKKFQTLGWRGTPVYLMGGSPDKILLGLTIAVMGWGFVGVGDFVWRNLDKK